MQLDAVGPSGDGDAVAIGAVALGLVQAIGGGAGDGIYRGISGAAVGIFIGLVNDTLVGSTCRSARIYRHY